jgi:PAS domain S-box-containing protein
VRGAPSSACSAGTDRCHAPCREEEIASDPDTDTVTPGHGFPAGGVFAAALDAVVVMDGDGKVRDWNPSAEEVFGHTWEEAVGREVAELIVPPAYRAAHRTAFQRYLDTREPTILGRRLQLSALHRDGREFPVELTIAVIRDVEPPLFAGFIRPVVARATRDLENERLQQRLAFLAHAGLTLDVSLDLEETMRRLVALTVPELAELAIIDLLAPGGSIRGAVAAGGSDPSAAAAVEQMRREHPLGVNGRHPVAQVLRTGKSMLLPEISPEMLREFAQGEEHYELMMRVRYRSAIVVPLSARGRLVGALSLLRMAENAPYDNHDRMLAETLARRAGLVLENARLYAATRHIARTLQQSLLPRAIPEIPGAHLAARYRAAAEGQDVGGDFYDVFPIAEGRWGIAIGDVCGKGPEAAALTSFARYTIRAVADRGPEQALELLNEAVLREPGIDRFLTALVGELRHDGDELVLDLAVGGHPAPLVLRANGTVERIAARGALIGVMPDMQYVPVRVRVGVGDTLLFYTDGLTDARAPASVLSEGDLAALLVQARDLDGQELAQSLELAATGGEQARDDIAILVVEAVGAGARAVSVPFFATTN